MSSHEDNPDDWDAPAPAAEILESLKVEVAIVAAQDAEDQAPDVEVGEAFVDPEELAEATATTVEATGTQLEEEEPPISQYNTTSSDARPPLPSFYKSGEKAAKVRYVEMPGGELIAVPVTEGDEK